MIRTVLVMLACSAAAIGAAEGRVQARPPAVEQVPVISNDPAVQRQIAAQLTSAASVRLDPGARVGRLQVSGRPLGEVLESIGQASGVTVRLAPGVVGLDAPVTLTMADQSVEDALRAVLAGRGLTFQAMGSKVALVYPDTLAEHEKYTAAIRVFPIARANAMRLTQQLNQSVKPTAEGFRPMILSTSDSRVIVVRAVPELMAWIAAWIAENDKQ